MFERSTNEYRGAIAPLSSALDGTTHKAVVLIERSIATLESYLSSETPTSAETLTASEGDSIARKGAEQSESNHEHADSDSTTDQGNESIDVPMESDD